jgi:hypothetical protein
MSKSREEDQPRENAAGTPAPEEPKDSRAEKEPGDPTVEELAEAAKTPAPVFAAVMQAQGWAEGKRIPKADYAKAVEEFLNGPAGGIRRGRKEGNHGAA